jgi:hypothetical protein
MGVMYKNGAISGYFKPKHTQPSTLLSEYSPVRSVTFQPWRRVHREEPAPEGVGTALVDRHRMAIMYSPAGLVFDICRLGFLRPAP